MRDAGRASGFDKRFPEWTIQQRLAYECDRFVRDPQRMVDKLQEVLADVDWTTLPPADAQPMELVDWVFWHSREALLQGPYEDRQHQVAVYAAAHAAACGAQHMTEAIMRAMEELAAQRALAEAEDGGLQAAVAQRQEPAVVPPLQLGQLVIVDLTSEAEEADASDGGASESGEEDSGEEVFTPPKAGHAAPLAQPPTPKKARYEDALEEGEIAPTEVKAEPEEPAPLGPAGWQLPGQAGPAVAAPSYYGAV